MRKYQTIISNVATHETVIPGMIRIPTDAQRIFAFAGMTSHEEYRERSLGPTTLVYAFCAARPNIVFYPGLFMVIYGHE